ncbi:hypothetical protein LBMAG12_17060 [Actinomycetes bacterium]|nr:hypothetical protein LBMAG12_17060 [Actinomycetes bacterium]
MANSRSRAKKRKKKKQSSSKAPVIFLCLLIAAAGAFVFLQVSESTSGNGSADSSVPTTSPTNTEAPSESLPVTTATPATDPSNLGKPVTIHSDDLGDLEIDQVIDDWAQVDPPMVPETLAQVDPSLVEGDYISGDLPDGFYVGYFVSAIDENDQGFTFDIRNSLDDPIPVPDGRQFYPALIDSLLFVSLPIVESEKNTAMSAAKFFELANAARVLVDIPKTNLIARITDTYMLLTIVDGAVIAIEGIHSS